MKIFNLVVVLLLAVTLIAGCSYEKEAEETIVDDTPSVEQTPTPSDTIDSEINTEIENIVVDEEEIDIGEMY